MTTVSLGTLFTSGIPLGAVTVTVAGAPQTIDARAVLTLLGASNAYLVLPITDPKAEYTDLADDWVEVQRPGRKPMLMRRGGKLRKLKLAVTVLAPSGNRTDSCEPILGNLLAVASVSDNRGNLAAQRPVALTYAPMDSASWLTMTGHWQITGCTVTSTVRQPGSNAVCQATAVVELTENSDPPSLPLLLTAVHATAAVALPGPAGPPRVAIVGSGDTLYSVAVRVYGAAEPGWRTLAAANAIGDPRALAAGQALIVP